MTALYIPFAGALALSVAVFRDAWEQRARCGSFAGAAVMARQHIDYGRRGSTRVSQGHDPDVPVAGYYRMRLRSGAVPVGVRIWFGAPIDPASGDEMDRAHRWQAHVNGDYAELDTVWPKCAADPIDQDEHDYLAATQAWGRQHAPNSPQANPTRRVDMLTAPLPF